MGSFFEGIQILQHPGGCFVGMSIWERVKHPGVEEPPAGVRLEKPNKELPRFSALCIPL